MGHKFNIGDRVVCIKEGIDDNYDLFVGCEGVVVDEPFDAFGEDWYPVDWDVESEQFHSCGDLARTHHGWNVPESAIEFADQTEIPPVEVPIELLFG